MSALITPTGGGAALSLAAGTVPVCMRCSRVRCSSAPGGATHVQEAALLRRAAEVADRSAGLTSPHPNFGCVISRGADVVGEGFLYAQGTKCAELQAVEMAGALARGATAYLNMEPGDCYADGTPVSSLVQAGVSRVVVGLRHPLQHLRGKAIQSLRSEGIQVSIISEELKSKTYEEALKSCLVVNAPLLYRAAFRIPFSVLKYAMTLDGKIAASSGHASWVSSKISRQRVFDLRGRSDAVLVGGNTVRRDDPRLTARHGGGHAPVRIVMSQTLDLPEAANLWNVSEGYTIVATQRGARKELQKKLASKGVEVVEFDILNPRDLMEYCYERGYLSVLWECGGNLAAPAIASGVIHKVYAFVAPKIIGGVNAPTPVGELGMIHMSQALNLVDVSYEQVRADWESAKIDVMYDALRCKFLQHSHLNAMLRSTAGSVLVEASPHDLFWGGGREGEGLNYLGRLLMRLRTEISEDSMLQVQLQ